MGAASSRKVLYVERESSEGVRHSKRYLSPFFTSRRLVRNKLRKEVQRCVHDEREVRDSLFVVQEPPESIQQKNVRPVLSVPPN